MYAIRSYYDKNNKVSLNWEVADNETVSHFELQKSVNGAAFKTAALVFSYNFV